VSPFIANYEKNLRMGIDIKRKGKIEKVMKFGKDEESARRDSGSIKESMGENEATSK